MLPFLRKLYDNYILINLVYDYSIILPCETAEKIVEDDIKDYEYMHIPWKSILKSAMLPEDMLDISKYEKYEDDNVYISAVEMRLRWQEYNEYLQIAIDELQSGNINENTYTKLTDLTESVFMYMLELDNMICMAEEKQFKVSYIKDKLYKDFKELITGHFIVWLGRHFLLNNQSDDILYNSKIASNDFMLFSFCNDYNADDLVDHYKSIAPENQIGGFMTAPWIHTTKENADEIVKGIRQLGEAKRKYYPEN